MSASPVVSSRQHPIVKRCRLLARGSRDGDVLLEGAHLVIEALEWQVPLIAVLATPDAEAETLRRAERAGAVIHTVTDAVLDAASPVRQPSGLVAIGRWQPASPRAALEAAGGPALGLVSVQDPGNLGSAIRSADALGARGVLALETAADPAGWKALRGAMGSTFHLPVARTGAGAAIAQARELGLLIAAATARSADATDPADLPPASLVLLGNEGTGLPGDLVDGADLRVAVPMRSGVESLNVAVTAALILDAARRATRATRAR